MRKAISLTFITIVLLGGLFVFEYSRFNDGLLHVVFCDVGQGDAVFIRTSSGKNFLIDGGPDRKVLNCLSEHMPFWERKIDMMILTHPHADHFVGMHYVLERYIVTQFATEKLDNKSGEFRELMKLLQEQEIPVRYVLKGDRWTIRQGITSTTGTMGDVVLFVLGPSKEFLDKTSPNGDIGDSSEFASLVIQLSYGSFHALLTGDSQVSGMEDALTDHTRAQIGVLQSPHHGSKTGLNDTIVQQIAPKMAIISSGKYNRYGHPHKEILDRFQQYKIPVFRTDKTGAIHVVSDGGKYWVKKEFSKGIWD